MSQNFSAGLQLHAETRVGKRLRHCPLNFEGFLFFCHKWLSI